MADVVGRKHWVLYYDGECGFCTRSVQALEFADFFRVVAWTDFRKLPNPPAGLTWDDLDAAAYLEVRKGLSGPSERLDEGRRLYRGFYAFRMLTLRLLPLMPLVPLLWLPGVNRLGEWAYGWVAANRHRISRKCRLKAGR